jgi:hypothetical protein
VASWTKGSGLIAGFRSARSKTTRKLRARYAAAARAPAISHSSATPQHAWQQASDSDSDRDSLGGGWWEVEHVAALLQSGPARVYLCVASLRHNPTTRPRHT